LRKFFGRFFLEETKVEALVEFISMENSNSSSKLPAPPIFGLKGGDEAYGKVGIISLDDIFEDFLLPDAKKFQNELENGKFDDEDDDDDDDDDEEDEEGGGGGKKRKKISKEMQRNMTEEQKVERRFVRTYYYSFDLFILYIILVPVVILIIIHSR